MRRAILFAALLLVTGVAPARAERICDIENRLSTIKDNEQVTVSGRITNPYRASDGTYNYDLADSCGEAYIGSDRPIKCRGKVTITGKYNEYMSMLEFTISIWATRVSCK